MIEYHSNTWSRKQIEFYHAARLYEHRHLYSRVTQTVAYLNIGLQWFLIFYALSLNLSVFSLLVIIFFAYVCADFVNGFVHLIMDHNDAYTSIMGPFIAIFHLHHDTPRYQNKPIWRVYVDESGYKIWLAILLILTWIVILLGELPNILIIFIAFFALFSSIAEVSHFLCHNRKSRWVVALQRYRVLLPRGHHMKHHRLDNVNYAFLNGMSDVVLNKIAQRFFTGYRNQTDTHTALYQYHKR